MNHLCDAICQSRQCGCSRMSSVLLLGVVIGALTIIGLNNNLDSQLMSPTEGTKMMTYSNRVTQRLPNCIIIGIRKAGTRALLETLNLHPQIQTARKEVRFFNVDAHFNRGYEWYRRNMPRTSIGQMTVEKTPEYFTHEAVPQRIHDMNDSIKLLLIVRDPFTRCVSDYLQMKVERNITNISTFENLAFDHNTGRVRVSYPPIMRSIYYLYMRNWLQRFMLNQFLIIDGDEFIKNPMPQLKLAEDFLGIEHKLTHDMFYFNKTRKFYCFRNDMDEKCLGKSKGRSHPDIDPKVVSALRQYFAPYNQIFYKMVERHFSWPEK